MGSESSSKPSNVRRGAGSSNLLMATAKPSLLNSLSNVARAVEQLVHR